MAMATVMVMAVTQSRAKLLLLISLFLISCARQDKFEAYTVKIKNETFSVNQKLEYRFKAKDTLQVFDIDVFMRLSSAYKDIEQSLTVAIFSPDGIKYTDTLKFNEGLPKELHRSGLWRDVRWQYRKGVIFPKSGSWLIRIENATGRDIDGVGEISIILTESDGKR
ncbi:MAG: hypothetical protein ACD_77C00224G0004 [uncultured bacterium]|nr:MAG: hypothetical protein ACD_77C00224G0004 [uncultured bacterium]HBY02522.1 hypothetical protein [Rikenellaceae bacterium]